MLLDVILHLRNLAGCATLFVQDTHYADFFTASGVYRISRYHIDNLRLPPSVWVLIDSNCELIGVPKWVTRFGCFIVQAASPKRERLKWQEKHMHVSQYFLKLAALVVVMCWPTQFTTDFTHSQMLHVLMPPSEAELNVFFDRHIPSALTAYVNASSISKYDDYLVLQLFILSAQDVINAASELVSLRIDDEWRHRIFVILPGRTRTKHVIAFASRYCLDTLVANVREANVTDKLFEAFTRNHFTRGAAGQLFVWDIFARGGVWKIHEMEMLPRPGKHNRQPPSSTYVDKYLIVGQPNHPLLISDTCPPEDVVFQPIKTHILPSADRVTLRTGYYLPASATEATFDSFYYEADEKQATVFQLTVSNHHPMTNKGLKWLQDLGVQSVRYVAVTGSQEDFDLPPPNEYSDFSKEKYHLALESLT